MMIWLLIIIAIHGSYLHGKLNNCMPFTFVVCLLLIVDFKMFQLELFTKKLMSIHLWVWLSCYLIPMSCQSSMKFIWAVWKKTQMKLKLNKCGRRILAYNNYRARGLELYISVPIYQSRELMLWFYR